MAIEFNHTLITCRNQQASASFLTQMLGLPEAKRFGVFLCVDLHNGVSLDFIESDAEFQPQHYAFLISEEEFDAVCKRIGEQNLDYWADPFRQQAQQINTNDGGRGLYFTDPDGHLLEVITRPYGSGGYQPGQPAP